MKQSPIDPSKHRPISIRLDRWMVDGIDILIRGGFDNRTDWIKRVLDKELRKHGLSPAIVRSRTSDSDNSNEVS